MTEQQNKEINEFLDKSYEFGFTTEIDSETLPPGINEDVIRIISSKKNEMNNHVASGFRQEMEE